MVSAPRHPCRPHYPPAQADNCANLTVARAEAPNFSYSSGLAAANFKWDDDKLGKWLTKPQGFIAGAKMPFNLPDAQQRADVIGSARPCTYSA